MKIIVAIALSFPALASAQYFPNYNPQPYRMESPQYNPAPVYQQPTPQVYSPPITFQPLHTAPVRVDGYSRRDGSYVPPHTRSQPDSNPYNNYGNRR